MIAYMKVYYRKEFDAIVALCGEAAVARDYAQVAICRRAYGTPLPSVRAYCRGIGIAQPAACATQDIARAECARVLADAAAQVDEVQP
jgi:hypothetical protein